MLASELKEWAARRGLVLGIALVRPFEFGEEALKWRAERGLKTPFANGSLEERCRPRLLYPAARSLVVVASPHPEPAVPPGPGEGLIARYALGPDYHAVLQGHLRDLAGLLQQAGASLTAIQVDSGPLLEREAAYLAGLGYYGASCNLIIPGLGSGASLGLLITDLDLEPGVPLEPAACEGCGRCLAACPSGALVAPGRLNPERCLSYLTQKRGVIPAELRPFFKQYIWGCDVCQEACPANRRERGGLRAEITSGSEQRLTWPDLAAIVTMDKDQFKQTFGPTALGWRGKTVLQRNAVLLLGNRGDPQALAPLAQALRAPAAVLRGHAAWALGHLGAAGRPVLEKARREETDPWVCREIEEALAFQ
ncbi:MAG: epoxyqueuosine reductase [Moorella sp. (in: firmicutes)]|uniref:tRNA epoxyqueuosine(34) reductase QueG n=1 Tax=Moorella sp. E306M TaxID=2572683 RepID=UPI0010FFC0BD|nr:tRNA epoxyqueuosine(34) reductase QueG [Moorella sp. E306M]MDK2815659.1 epoxyqueuosine reductase [Moorella sp. (in: firmicutes)]GEA17548.1 4Fe-4S ferredoxin [Moorella sp. E306M]